MEILRRGISAEPIRSIAALSMIFCSISLLLTRASVRSSKQEAVRVILAGAVVLISGLILVEYLFVVDFGVDQLLPFDPMAGRYPGRLPPNTALSFFAVALSLILLPRFTRLAKTLALITGLLSVVAALGYLLAVPELYGFGGYARMSSTAAVGLVLLFLGIVFTRPEEGYSRLFVADTLGGFILRRLIVFALAVSPLLHILQLIAENSGLLSHSMSNAFSVLADILIFLLLTWFLALRLDATDRERKRAERSLQQSHAELEQKVEDRTSALQASNQELEAFSYSVSHDLRAPLRGIDGFSQALLEDYGDKLDETGKRYLAFIRSGTQRMGRLIDDLLSLSRLSRTEMKAETVDLSSAAIAVVEAIRKQDPMRNVEVKIQPGLAVQGDSGLLRVVLENLLGNAWKFSSKQERAVVEFGATQRDGDRAFYVRDNGAGFDMAYAGKLFGAFQRLHGAQEFAGTGIGLTTVRRIITRHGGKVWAEGAVGKGATFYFTIQPREGGYDER